VSLVCRLPLSFLWSRSSLIHSVIHIRITRTDNKSVITFEDGACALIESHKVRYGGKY